MKTLGQLWWCIKRLLFGLLGVILLYILAAFIGSVWATNPTAKKCDHHPYEAFVTTNGIHLDIVIPLTYLPEQLIHPSYFHDSITHVAFGWGERDFYLTTPTWEDLTVGAAAQALLVSSESLMHVRRYHKEQPSWARIALCESAMESLLSFVENSFRKDENKSWAEVPSTGYSQHDFFYEAHGQYHAINTCNTWINNALKAAGVKTGRWSPMPQGILWHLEQTE